MFSGKTNDIMVIFKSKLSTFTICISFAKLNTLSTLWSLQCLLSSSATAPKIHWKSMENPLKTAPIKKTRCLYTIKKTHYIPITCSICINKYIYIYIILLYHNISINHITLYQYYLYILIPICTPILNDL